MGERLRLAAWIALVLLMSGVAFGAVILGIPTAYGPDSQECWWLELLRDPRGQKRSTLNRAGAMSEC